MAQGIFDIANNINIEIPTDLYNKHQLVAIKCGLNEGLDISWYANPEFSFWQMDEIMTGLEKGLDVSKYAKKEFEPAQMRELRNTIEEGFDISDMLDPEISWDIMRAMRNIKVYNREHKEGKV